MNHELKVLHLGLSPNQGGIESVVHSWWQMLEGSGISFDFTNVYKEPIAFERDFVEGGSLVYHLPSRKESPKKHIEELRKTVLKGNYDYVHCHVMSLSEPEPVAVCNEDGVRSQAIVHSHTVPTPVTMPLKRRLLHFYGKTVLRRLDYLKVACGHAAGFEMFGCDDFDVVENGVDAKRFRFSAQKRMRFRREHGIPSDVFVVGHVGRPDRAKNYPCLIETFSRILQIDGSAVLLLIGAVENDVSIQGLIDRFGIRNNCVMTGKLSSMEECYSAMDVFFLPSLYEGFSVSAIEAQASGVRCVLSDQIPREHAISNRVTFMPITDVGAIAGEICERINPSFEERMESAIDSRYDSGVATRKMLQFYWTHAVGSGFDG